MASLTDILHKIAALLPHPDQGSADQLRADIDRLAADVDQVEADAAAVEPGPADPGPAAPDDTQQGVTG